MNCQDILNKLQQLLEDVEEIETFKLPNSDIDKTLKLCWNYCRNQTMIEEVKKLEIESILDFLQDELNTGHWSEVPLVIRRGFSIASYVKCLILLKNANVCNVQLLQESLKCLDIGLLLGAPLQINESLLTESARELTKIINQNASTVIPDLKHEFKRCLEEERFKSFNELNAKVVDEAECPSIEYFNKNYFLKQLPIKLKGCMDHWPASKKWLDINYLLKVAGDRTVPIEIGSQYVDENWTQKLVLLKDFIKEYFLNDNKEVGYLAQHNLFEQISELKDDICIPEYCCLSADDETNEEPDVNAWFGPKGTISPLHHDPKNNILTQIFGTKQVILFRPEDGEYLYPHEGLMLCNTAQVDPVNPEAEKFPNFPKATMFKCLLGPGEMLFLPKTWWHHVTAFDKSFSVSFWWK